MKKKSKTFDCVEMKRRAQQQLMSEYEAQKDKFKSYSEFLQFKVSRSPWQSKLWAKLKGRKKRSGARA